MKKLKLFYFLLLALVVFASWFFALIIQAIKGYVYVIIKGYVYVIIKGYVYVE